MPNKKRKIKKFNQANLPLSFSWGVNTKTWQIEARQIADFLKEEKDIDNKKDPDGK